MTKYKVIKDIKLLDTVILKEGDEVEIKNGESLKIDTPFGYLEFSFDNIKSSLKEEEKIEITITELDEEDEIKEWRLQLDIKANRRKAREIEKYLRETLAKML